MTAQEQTCRDGFTLVELLVVVAIISILLSLLVPSLQRSRELTRRAICAADMHQIHGAIATYSAERREWLPPMNDWSANHNSISCAHWTRWFYVDGQGYWNLGNLYLTGQITDGQLFYCPSQRDVNFIYNSYTPWPRSTQPAPTAALGVRVGYGYNPYVRNPAGDYRRLYQHSSSFPSSNVLLMDLLEGPTVIAHDFEPGWNVLSGDGGARFVVEKTIADVEMRDGNFAGTPLVSFDSAVHKLELAPR